METLQGRSFVRRAEIQRIGSSRNGTNIEDADRNASWFVVTLSKNLDVTERVTLTRNNSKYITVFNVFDLAYDSFTTTFTNSLARVYNESEHVRAYLRIALNQRSRFIFSSWVISRNDLRSWNESPLNKHRWIFICANTKGLGNPVCLSKKARNNVAFVTIDLSEYYQAVRGDPCDLSPLWLHNSGKN